MRRRMALVSPPSDHVVRDMDPAGQGCRLWGREVRARPTSPQGGLIWRDCSLSKRNHVIESSSLHGEQPAQLQCLPPQHTHPLTPQARAAPCPSVRPPTLSPHTCTVSGSQQDAMIVHCPPPPLTLSHPVHHLLTNKGCYRTDKCNDTSVYTLLLHLTGYSVYMTLTKTLFWCLHLCLHVYTFVYTTLTKTLFWCLQLMSTRRLRQACLSVYTFVLTDWGEE